MTDTRLISIIVPIYNVEKYLKECLNSFLFQTVKNFVVLLIDDGSTDSSGEIAKEYTSKNPELFKYIHQENKGLGGARNTGISLVNTEYVMFFDSDDFMANRAIEAITDKIKSFREPVDIIFFNPVIYDVVTHAYEEWHDVGLMKFIFQDKDMLDPSQTPRLMESEASVCRAVWNANFLKRINLKFLEHVRWEDVPPHFVLMHEAKSATYLDYSGAYFYRANHGTQITAGSGKTRLDMKYIFEDIAPIFKSKDWTKREKSYILSFLSNYLFWSINVIDDTYKVPFTDICHEFFKKISFGQYLDFFLHTESCLRNKLLIWYLKSNVLYKNLYSTSKIKQRMKVFKKIKAAFGK